ncbi:hypothetical protein SARC_06132, partial [Sphaeroforma arctica JP610]
WEADAEGMAVATVVQAMAKAIAPEVRDGAGVVVVVVLAVVVVVALVWAVHPGLGAQDAAKHLFIEP